MEIVRHDRSKLIIPRYCKSQHALRSRRRRTSSVQRSHVSPYIVHSCVQTYVYTCMRTRRNTWNSARPYFPNAARRDRVREGGDGGDRTTVEAHRQIINVPAHRGLRLRKFSRAGLAYARERFK